ncbi:MAG TPA: acyltransferase [Gemmatimonadaceae bacterium]
MTNSRHIRALDGVRGLAIILVMFRHLSLKEMGRSPTSPFLDRAVHSIASLGWVGVDLFFVLSGFLITGILLDAKGKAGAFPRFWKRRALRIFPLYYVACAVLFFVLPHVGYFARDPATARLVHYQAWYWLYAVNILEVLRGGLATPLNTAHFWSLSVEEQFYLAWPFVVLIVSRRTLWRVVVWMSIAALGFRLALVLFTSGGWVGAYVLSIARMDILGAGAIVALAARTPGALETARRYAPTVGIASIAVISLLALQDASGFNNVNPYIATIGYSVLAVLGSCLLVLVLSSRDGSGWKRPFEGKTLRMFGKYSYCLYIVHYPLMIPLDSIVPKFHVRRPFSSDLGEWAIYTGLLFGISLCVAWVSWRVWEAPMLSLKDTRILRVRAKSAAR